MPAVDKLFRRRGWHSDLPLLAGIIALGVVLYAHTLSAPMYLDDHPQIIANPDVLNLSSALANIFTSARGIVTLTFAINYRLGGTGLAGYHLVNIIIHLLTACLVYLLLKRVFRDRPLLYCGGALLFVAHPLQTQAVTYIVQRSASLAGLFFFLSLYLYVRARESREAEEGGNRPWLWYAGSLICGALAVLIKQNAAVLPVALLLFDRFFLPQGRLLSLRRLLLYLAPFAVVPVWLGISNLLPPLLAQGEIGNIGSLPDLMHLRHNSPINYLATEFIVVWLYLRLLMVPYGQALEYDIPISSGLWHWSNAISLLGIALLLTTAFLVRKRLPTVSAGVFWFFLTLSVESTIIPLDPVFEHRLYIPMFGVTLIAMSGLGSVPRRVSVVLLATGLGILAILTWQRNDLWNDPVAFYEDNLRQAPRNERVHLTLGNLYGMQGRLVDAQHLFEQALEINPGYAQAYVSLSNVFITQKRYDQAIGILRKGLQHAPEEYGLYNNLGHIYNLLGDHRAAAEILQTAISLQPNSAEAHYSLGVAYHRQDLPGQAAAAYRRAITLKYDVPMDFYFNLALALLQNNQPGEALPVLQTCYRLQPANAEVLYHLALVNQGLGNLAEARIFATQLRGIDLRMANRLSARGL